MMLDASSCHSNFYSDNSMWQQQTVAYAAENGIVDSFTDYNTPASRGFVFEVGYNAWMSCEDDGGDDLTDVICQLTGECDGNTDTGTDNGGDVVIDGDLEVTLSPETPASATIPAGVNGLPVAAFDFTAGAEDVTVTQLTLKRRGLSDKDTLSSLALFTSEGRASNEKNDNQENDTEAQLNLSSGGLVVKAGETQTVWVVVDIPSLSTNPSVESDEFAIQLKSVVSTAETIEGLDNLVANTMRIGSVDAPMLTFKNGSNVSDPKLGEDEADIFKFEIEGDNDEDVVLRTLTFEGSSDAEDDLANFKLYHNNALVAETAMMKNDYLTFNLGEGLLIGEDKNEDFTVKADVVAGATDTISFVIDKELDVTAQSTKYGYGAAVNIDDVDEEGELGSITIQAGELTIVEIESEYDEIRENKDNVVLGGFKVTNVAGQNLELQQFGVLVTLTATGSATINGNPVTAATIFDNVELYGEQTGSYELSPVSTSTTNTVFLEDNIDVLIPQGTTTWWIRADTAEDIVNFDQVKFQLSFETGKANKTTKGAFYVEETEDGEEVKDITPSNVSFNTIDGAESGADLAAVPLSATREVVRGAQNVVAMQFEIEAAQSSDLYLNQVNANVTVSGSTFSSTNTPNKTIAQAKLYLGSVSDSNLLDAESGSNIANNGDIVFDDFDDVLIKANDTQNFVITLDIVDSSDAVANSGLRVSLSSISLEDDDNDDVTASPTFLNYNRTIIVEEAGTIQTLAYDSANAANEYKKVILAGSKSAPVVSFDVRADNEPIDVEDVVFTYT